MKRKLLSLLLAFVMVLGMFPMSAMAADDITVYVTISNKGVLAADKNGDPMGYRAVTVTDRDSDGKLTIYDAYDAAHSQLCDSEFLVNGSGMVGQLWGDRSGSFLTFVNNAGISGDRLENQTVADGDHLIGAILKDTSYWSDYYSFFDATEKEVRKGAAFTLTLKGRAGMSWSGTPDPDAVLGSIAVGTWDDGRFSAVDGKTTNAAGQVTLSFDAAGTYYVTASGNVRSNGSVSGAAPIIAPICVVTVTEEKTDAEYVADDAAALSVTYTNGQDLSLPAKGQSGKTAITWISDKPDVISGSGAVTVPAEDTVVTLTATVTCNEESATKEFKITIPGRLKGAKAALAAAILKPVEFTNPTDSGYKYDSAAKDTNILDVARAALNDDEITLAFADSFAADAVIAADGTITYPADEAREITVPLKLTFNGQTEEIGVTAVIPKHAQTKAEAINEMKAAMPGYMADAKVLNGNASLDEVKTTLLLPGGKTSGLYITWASDNESVIKVTGNPSSSSGHPSGGKYTVAVTRPDVGQSDATVTLTATFVYKQTSIMCGAGPMPDEADRKMTFTVKVPAVTGDEMQAMVDNAAADIRITDKNGVVADLANIRDNLYFPTYEGYTVKWTTDLPIAIPSKGYDKSTVTRPTDGTDAVGTITLTLRKGTESKSKSFDAKVLAWTEDELNAERAKLQKVADALTFDEIKNKNSAPTAVTSNLYLRQNAKLDGETVIFNTYNSSSYPYQIAWTITPGGTIAFNNGTGKITTPAQDTEISLMAAISLKTPIAGVNAVEKTITVTVLSAETVDYLELMDNIAARFAASGVAEDANAPWLVADMAAYLKLFPDTANKLSAEQKQAVVDLAIEKLAAAETVGDAAKYIIALVSMGYDPAQLTTAKLDQVNAVEKLNALSFGENGAVTDAAKSPYTLPYVLIAYQQFGNTYKTQIDALVAAAVETKTAWMDTLWGPDSITPMVLALAPYSSKTEVAAALEEAKTAIVSTQKGDGSLYDNAASTGLGVVAYAALGVDPKTVAVADKHLLDGLMAYVADSEDSFEEPYGGTFNTEQGFRGLIACCGLKAGSPYYLYDFAGQTLVPAAATESWAENCGVRIITTPADAAVVVKQGDTVRTAFKPGCYDLPAGEYECIVTRGGYNAKSGTFTVTDEDVAAGTKTLRVTLVTESVDPPDRMIDVSISVENPRGGYFQPELDCEVKAGTTAAELLKSLDLRIVSSNHAEYGFYVESINGVGEFDFGSGSGWMFKINGEFPKVSAANYVLKDGDCVEWVYTRDLGSDVGAGSYKKPLSAAERAEVKEVKELIDAIGKVTAESGEAIKAARKAYDALNAEQRKLVTNYDELVAAEKKFAELTGILPFADVSANDYFYEAVKWAAEKGITGGTSATTFSPYANCTRAQMVTFLWRAAGCPEPAGTASVFADVDQNAYYYQALLWAVESGITGGTSVATFSPNAVCTRGQMAMFLYRSAKTPAVSGSNPFTDVSETAYYRDAVLWAKTEGITSGTTETTFGPDAACTRAQMVTFLYRCLAE